MCILWGFECIRLLNQLQTLSAYMYMYLFEMKTDFLPGLRYYICNIVLESGLTIAMHINIKYSKDQFNE